MHLIKHWFNRMFWINTPIIGDGGGSFQQDSQPRLWKGLLQPIHNALSIILGLSWGQFSIAGHTPVSNRYMPLEVLPDYYLNCDNAKRLWQDWRVLRRLFLSRDHSRDLLLQGQSGWLPIHGMTVHRQALTVTTDEGEKVLDLEEEVVWLSRANPANTQISQEPIWANRLQRDMLWSPA